MWRFIICPRVLVHAGYAGNGPIMIFSIPNSTVTVVVANSERLPKVETLGGCLPLAPFFKIPMSLGLVVSDSNVCLNLLFTN